MIEKYHKRPIFAGYDVYSSPNEGAGEGIDPSDAAGNAWLLEVEGVKER